MAAAEPASSAPRGLPAPTSSGRPDDSAAATGLSTRVRNWRRKTEGSAPDTNAAPDTHAARDKWYGYAAQGALVIAIVGFGWTVGGHLYAGRGEGAAKDAAFRAKMEADTSEQRRATMALAADMKALKASLDQMKTGATRAATPDELHALERNLDALKGKLDAAKVETGATLAQLGSKLDHVGDGAPKLREMADRLERIEKQTAAPLTTASIQPPAATVTPKPVQLPPAKPAVAEADAHKLPTAPPPADSKGPQLIAGWVVRDVYDGVALVESRRGAIEVVPGESIPGAGTVRSIERRGAGWVVLTNRGLVDYARN